MSPCASFRYPTLTHPFSAGEAIKVFPRYKSEQTIGVDGEAVDPDKSQGGTAPSLFFVYVHCPEKKVGGGPQGRINPEYA